jgi:hypothetical protein
MMAQGTATPLGGEQVYSEDNQRKLAAAVFRIALEDLKASHPNDRRTALHFLLKSERDFSFWCHRLEVDPEVFRKGLCKHVLGPHEGFSGLVSDLS